MLEKDSENLIQKHVQLYNFIGWLEQSLSLTRQGNIAFKCWNSPLHDVIFTASYSLLVVKKKKKETCIQIILKKCIGRWQSSFCISHCCLWRKEKALLSLTFGYDFGIGPGIERQLNRGRGRKNKIRRVQGSKSLPWKNFERKGAMFIAACCVQNIFDAFLFNASDVSFSGAASKWLFFSSSLSHFLKTVMFQEKLSYVLTFQTPSPHGWWRLLDSLREG